MLNNKEALILVIISFLLAILVYGSVAKFDTFARSSITATGCTKREPTKPGATSASECCWLVTNYQSGKITQVYSLCQTCEYDSNGNKIDCRNTSPSGRNVGDNPGILAGGGESSIGPQPPPPPPSNALPPSTTCPDGSAPDANGNCPSSSTLQQTSPNQNLASNNNNDNNNNPQDEHHHKGTNLLGQESTSKKGDNNEINAAL